MLVQCLLSLCSVEPHLPKIMCITPPCANMYTQEMHMYIYVTQFIIICRMICIVHTYIDVRILAL